MTYICNRSLYSAVVLSSLRKAHVWPLLKNPGLDAECSSNYKSVSSLFFIHKQTERVVAACLTEYLSCFDLAESLQSAYCDEHSCETSLSGVQNDILRAVDVGKVGI